MAESLELQASNASKRFRVVLRCRPLEVEGGETCVEECTNTTILIKSNHEDQFECFEFDKIFKTNATQRDIFEEVSPIIGDFLQGKNGSVFAYGQTGSGKTHTIRGMMEISTRQIFEYINASNEPFKVCAAYIEIYNEELRDLLHDKKLCDPTTKNGKVFIRDLQTNVCRNLEELRDAIRIGDRNRTVRATNMNAQSSRSHAIFSITLQTSRFHSKFNLIDLAGSEKLSRTGESEMGAVKETAKINLSLSALGNVVRALEKNHQHIPYRGSKLTRLLEDSLGGECKTLIIATISLSKLNRSETLSTLRFACSAKLIKQPQKIQQEEEPKEPIVQTRQTKRIVCLLSKTSILAVKILKRLTWEDKSLSHEKKADQLEELNGRYKSTFQLINLKANKVEDTELPEDLDDEALNESVRQREDELTILQNKFGRVVRFDDETNLNTHILKGMCLYLLKVIDTFQHYFEKVKEEEPYSNEELVMLRIMRRHQPNLKIEGLKIGVEAVSEATELPVNVVGSFAVSERFQELVNRFNRTIERENLEPKEGL